MRTGQRLATLLAIMVLCVLYGAPLAQTIHPKGATIWDPFKARNGYTFISAPDGTARLVGMLGELIRTWSAGDDDSLLIKMPILQSRGHILAFRGPISVPGYVRARGSIVTEYDFRGAKVWEYAAPPTIDTFRFGGFHHDMTRLENGNTLVLASVLVDGTFISNKTLIDDCVFEINPAGEVVWAWYTFQHFAEFGFSLDARVLIWARGGDWAHANAVTVVPPNSLGDPRFAPGNLVISYRDLNTIIVIDRGTGSIVWKVGPGDGRTIGQHFAHMIPLGLEGAGRIMAFDNGGAGGYPEIFRPFSRVVEIDTASKNVAWQYTAARSGVQNWTFFAPFISSAQRLAGGNTLIVEGTKGRIFEVTPAGSIVWEYMSPFAEVRQEGDGTLVRDYNVYRAFRLPAYWPFFGASTSDAF